MHRKNILNYNSRCHQGCVLGCSGIWNECVNSEDLRLGKGKRPLTLGFFKKKKKKLYCRRQCGVLGWLKHENHCLVARRKIRSSVRTQISPFPQFLKLVFILDGAHSISSKVRNKATLPTITAFVLCFIGSSAQHRKKKNKNLRITVNI